MIIDDDDVFVGRTSDHESAEAQEVCVSALPFGVFHPFGFFIDDYCISLQ